MNKIKNIRGTSRVPGFGLAAALFLSATPGWAANIVVDSSADSAQDGAPCTLREAIVSANTNPGAMTNGCMSGEAGATDTISFAEGVDTITLNGSELPALSDPVAITGPVTIDAAGNSRIVTNQTTTTLTDLTLINGEVTGDGASGGAILNAAGGVLTVNGGAMNNNTSVRAGGAIEEASGAAAGTAAVTLNDVDFSGNNAGTGPGNGGVLHVTGTADVAISGGTFDNNTAVEGGALWNNGGTMTIDDAVISNNVANGGDADAGDADAQGGGGVFNQAGTVIVSGGTRIAGNMAAGDVSSGGGVFTNEGTTLTVTDAQISGNSANRAGGGIEVRDGASAELADMSLSGNIANTTAGGGGGNGGGLHVSGDSDVTVQTSVVANNRAASEGGGLWNNQGVMTVAATSIVSNTASGDEATQGGGGLYNQDGVGTLNITDSRVVGNVADGTSGSGGGILNSEGATTNVTSSTISANTANRAGGGIENTGTVTLAGVVLGGTNSNFANNAGVNPGNGGGLHNGGSGAVSIDDSSVGSTEAAEGGGLWNAGGASMSAANTTVSNNQASGDGGGLYQIAGGNTTLGFATVARNSAGGDGGGLGVGDGASAAFTVSNSVIAGNSAGGSDDNFAASDATVDDTTITSASALGDYRLFGGETATHPLQSGSDAIGAADTGACADVAGNLDQRGAERPGGDSTACDSGAFEAADNPVIRVTNNNSEAAEFDAQSTNQVVLALTLANNSDEDVNVGGFSGALDVNRVPEGFDPRELDLSVVIDENGNGRMDSGEMAASATATLNEDRTFSVQFDGGAGRMFSAGDSVSYLLVAQSSTDMAVGTMSIYAGGTLLGLLGLFSIGGVRRRTQWVLVIAVLTVALVGCDDDDGEPRIGFRDDDGNVGNGQQDVGEPLQGDLRFVAFTVDAPDGMTAGDDFIVGDGMPVRGPALTFGGMAADDDSEGEQ